MRFWLWWIWVGSCSSPIPAPPLGEDTTIKILREVYAARQHFLLQSAAPSVVESLLAIHTHRLLRYHGVDSLRWEAVRRYYATYPQRWQELLDRALRQE